MKSGIAVLALFACGCDLYATAPSPYVASTTPVPPGAICPNGGVALSTGPDDDGDGALDQDEITDTTYACTPNGAPGQLVRVRFEPPGSNCANGGEQIQTGIDSNGNGVLDDGEVSSTTYSCAPAAPRSLIRVEHESAGSNCPNGGTAIHSGADADADGVLEPDEYANTSYVCVPPSVLQQLVSVVAEPAGPNCASGGQEIDLGYDLNGDAILGANEITSVSYVCNAGGNIVVDVVPEPAGSNCAAGGKAILTGVDDNQDDVLEDNEVDARSYVCNPSTTIEGDYTIHVQADVDAIAGVTVITGTLRIDSPIVTGLELPSLHSVGWFSCGSWASSCPLQTISFPNLATVTEQFHVMGGLSNLDLPRLRVARSFGLESVLLTDIDLPALESAWVDLYDSQFLQTLSLPNLRTSHFLLKAGGAPAVIDLPSFESGDVDIRGSAHVTAIEIPIMTNGVVSIEGLPNLANLHIPSFAEGVLQVRSTGLVQLEAPSFTSFRLNIDSNSFLSSLSVPSLAALEYGSFLNNPKLPTCEIVALWTELGFPNTPISGNDDSATCP